MNREGFDPRYDPEFQRGFDPAIHAGPAVTPQSHERIPSPAEPAEPRIPPVPSTPGTPRQVPAPNPAGSVEPGSPGDPDDGREGELEDEAAAGPWRNPYLITLTIVGVVLLAAGIAAFRWSVAQVYGGVYYDSGLSQEDLQEAMLAAQLAWGLSPLLALAGALTLLGVLFFVALRWQPRRRWSEGEALSIDDMVG